MRVEVELPVNAPAKTVWEILAVHFGDIGKWCATVNSSEYVTSGNIPEGATCSGRECDTIFGDYVESFTNYDHDGMSMSYDATSKKLPFFIRKFFNNYTVDAVDDASCVVTMIAGADMRQPFRFLLSPIMKMQVGKALVNQVEELRHYAETGAPHPRKVKAQAKADKKAKA